MHRPVRGIIFDMDGTLVDSGLDFEAMREEMGLARGSPLLETIEQLDEDGAARCRVILERHELAGAARATLFPGVVEFLAATAERGIRRAIFTRNSRRATLATLARLGLEMDLVVAREDAPPKPDPTGIEQILAAWGLAAAEAVMVGDFEFDLLVGRRAGLRTVLFAEEHPAFPSGVVADRLMRSYAEGAEVWEW